jgi:hypothetical protein
MPPQLRRMPEMFANQFSKRGFIENPIAVFNEIEQFAEHIIPRLPEQ